jgi:hypothetical protein
MGERGSGSMSNFSRRNLEGLLAGGVAIKPAVLQV